MTPAFTGFVVNPSYKIMDGKPVVYLWGRLDDGRSFLVRKSFEPYFFIETSQLDLAKDAISQTNIPIKDFSATMLKSMSGEKVSKVIAIIPTDVRDLRKSLENAGVRCYEADIRFAYRAMMDWGVKSTISIAGEAKKADDLAVDLVFDEPEVGPSKDKMPKLSTLSFDIESNKHTGDVYCISCYGLDTNEKKRKKSLLVSNEKIEGVESFPDEASMLVRFAELVREWDPDIITGWNVVDFDFAHLESRYRKFGKEFAISRNRTSPRLRIQTNFFRESTADVMGRVVIDGIAALKGAFIKLPNYRLATAAKKYTDDKKLIELEGTAKYEEIIRLYNEDKKSLVVYNMKDAELAHSILEKSGVLGLTIKRSILTGMPPDRVNASIAGLDSLYLRELREKGYVAPCAGGNDSDIGVGGFVMQSRPGVYDYVIVCDFKSLYPSIMRTFNIDPLMYSDKDDKNLIEAPNGARFKRELGIIPGIIQRFWKARDQAKKEGDELARFAIKIHMNSIYGVLASPNCRFFNRQVGNAITSFAQHFIKLTAEEVKKLGYDVIYGDTDSIFIDLKVNDLEQAGKIGRNIQDEMNKFLKHHVKTTYNLESYLELEFEKTYLSFIMPKVRGGVTGAKKRYAGLVQDKDGKEKIVFTGLESVRRDWTDAAKEFQYQLFNRVFHKKDVTQYVRDYLKELKEGKHDDKLIYRKALRKGVEEYTKTTPPHVKAARLLDSIESNIIEYYVTIDGPEPLQKLKHRLDYEHYIEKQLKPIADSILDLYGTSFDEQLEGSTQKSLFEF